MTALVEWLWQGLALVLTASLALRVCRKLDAASRYAIWCVVLFAVLALPIIPVMAAPDPAPASVSSVPPDFEPPRVATLAIPAPPDWVVSVTIGAWLGWVLLGLFRVSQGLFFAGRVKRRSVAVAASRQRQLPMWSASLPGRRAVSLRHAPWIRSACVVGGPRPVIALPSAWLETLDDDALDQVVMHEQAHIERFDDVARLVEAGIECVAGWHPAVRLAMARLDVEREAACDDRVVLQTGEVARYASCLADAAAALCGAALEPQLVPRVFGRVSALQARVARLLDRSRERRARLRPAVVGIGTVTLAVTVVAAGQLDPIVVVQQARVTRAASMAVVPSSERVSVAEIPPSRVSPSPATANDRPSPRRVPLGARSTVATAPAPAAPVVQPERPAADEPGQGSAPPLALTSRTLDVTTEAPATPAPRGAAAIDQPSPSPWAAAAQGGVALGNAAGRGGVAVGTGSKKAGSAIGGFFARAGRAIGKSF